MRAYSVLVERDPDSDDELYIVTVPALPGCFSQGRSIDEALDRAREAIEGHIATLVDVGEPVPVEAEPPRLFSVHVSAPATAA